MTTLAWLGLVVVAFTRLALYDLRTQTFARSHEFVRRCRVRARGPRHIATAIAERGAATANGQRDAAALEATGAAVEAAVAAADAAIISRVVSAVDEACVWYVRRARCLQRSAITTCMLRRRGVPAELVIGVRPLPIDSHAWVEVRGVVVNDRPQYQQRFRVLDRL